MRRGVCGEPAKLFRLQVDLAIRGSRGLAVLAGPLSGRAADDLPQGCVSCHVVMEDKVDKRLGPMLAEIGRGSIKGKANWQRPGHADVSHPAQALRRRRARRRS
jgi:hypothetical protein